MFKRITGAILRGLLVALLIAIPAFVLPDHTTRAAEIIALLAIVAAGLTIAEYNTNFPSIVEFRDAPPLNRLRFIALFLMVLLLSLVARNYYAPTGIAEFFGRIARVVGHYSDFPFSPVRLVIRMLPDGSPTQTVLAVRDAAGVAYAIALIIVLTFIGAVRISGWPTGNGPFNVWINLPRFDPTTGGDVVYRLKRDGTVNAVLGIALPFLIPTLVRMTSDLIDPITLSDPHTLIWTISAWAFLPLSIMMRGIAMLRIAELVETKRNRSSEKEHTPQVL